MKSGLKLGGAILSATIICGCATQGTVTPLEGGVYKSYVEGQTKSDALAVASSDAELTCKDAGGKYVVSSQDTVRNGPEEIKVGNQWLDTAISISEVGDDIREKTTYEVTTVFKCQ